MMATMAVVRFTGAGVDEELCFVLSEFEMSIRHPRGNYLVGRISLEFRGVFQSAGMWYQCPQAPATYLRPVEQ